MSRPLAAPAGAFLCISAAAVLRRATLTRVWVVLHLALD